jgi:hypothetical protein
MKGLKNNQKVELKARIERIWERVLFTKSCYKFCYRLYHPANQRELEFLGFDQALSFLRIVLFRSTVLELVKLYSRADGKSESREKAVCVFRFIEHLRKDGHFGMAGIRKEQLDTWESEIEAKMEQLNNLLQLRDEVIAHEGKKDIKNETTFSDLDTLISLAETVVSSIYERVFESSVYIHEKHFDDSVSSLIENAVKPYSERMDFLEAELIRVNKS